MMCWPLGSLIALDDRIDGELCCDAAAAEVDGEAGKEAEAGGTPIQEVHCLPLLPDSIGSSLCGLYVSLSCQRCSTHTPYIAVCGFTYHKNVI